MAGQTAVNDAEVVGGERERRMRPGGFAQRAAKLKTCRICECRSAGEDARFVELTDSLDALELDRAGREQVVLREHDLLRAAQQICLTRTGERAPEASRRRAMFL